jgi:hypothetical protein
MRATLHYVKGHMGGNLIALLWSEDTEEIGLEVLLRAIDILDVHEAGALYRPKSERNHLYVRIVGRSSRRFITACGGLTQVLGKALLESKLKKYFSVEYEEPVTTVRLETDGGLVELGINTRGGRVTRVTTDMSSFVRECYREGIHQLRLDRVRAVKVGKFLVVNANDIKRWHPLCRFGRLDSYSASVLKRLQDVFQARFCTGCFDFALYDLNPEHVGHVRAVFPHNIATGHIEPSCGTGSIAIGLALLSSGRVVHTTESGEKAIVLYLEEGKEPPGLGGPDLVRVEMRVRGDEVVKAYFSHSRVEILSEGVLTLGD